jgi:hypothetical protein
MRKDSITREPGFATSSVPARTETLRRMCRSGMDFSCIRLDRCRCDPIPGARSFAQVYETESTIKHFEF